MKMKRAQECGCSRAKNHQIGLSSLQEAARCKLVCRVRKDRLSTLAFARQSSKTLRVPHQRDNMDAASHQRLHYAAPNPRVPPVTTAVCDFEVATSLISRTSACPENVKAAFVAPLPDRSAIECLRAGGAPSFGSRIFAFSLKHEKHE